MNCTAWADGLAGRISTAVPTQNFERVYVAVDIDAAGATALEKACAIRPDVIPSRSAGPW